MSQQTPRPRRHPVQAIPYAGPTACLRCDDTFKSWDRQENRLCPKCRVTIAARPSDETRTDCLSAGGETEMRGEGRDVLVREDKLCIKDTLRQGCGVIRVAAGVPTEDGATVVRHAARNGSRPLDTPVPEAVRPNAVRTALPVTPPHVIPQILVANSGMIDGDRGLAPSRQGSFAAQLSEPLSKLLERGADGIRALLPTRP
jgi:hypothetical protein